MDITKFTLFVGLNDKDSKQQEISTVDAYKIISNMIPAIFDGGTISEATGIYKHQDGTFTTETTLRIEILFASAEQIKPFVAELKKVLNQETIAVQKEVINSELW
jgi:hypothetical protein